MKAHRWISRSCIALSVVLASWGMAWSQDPALPFEPMHRGGASVTGSFEGWYPNQDGTFSMLVGYYNRNLRDAVDIPIGPNNAIEPGGPDQGQPTHFQPGRGWAVLVVKVPKDFGKKSITWTLTTAGVTTKIPFDLNVLYRVSPYVDANDNTPPYVGFADAGPFEVGPPMTTPQSMTATVGTPLPLTIWVADAERPNALPGTPTGGAGMGAGPDSRKKKEPVTLKWYEYRGPGTVKFSDEEPDITKLDAALPNTDNDKFAGKSTTTATFSAPGQYELYVQAANATGVSGFQCCWTTAKVNVTVTGGSGNE